MITKQQNGNLVLSSFAELATVLDADTFPSDCPDPERAPAALGSTAIHPQGTAGLMAQLATLSTGLETAARHDAHAREQATLEAAQYEALVAEREEAEGALAEVRRLRALAEQLAIDAFTVEARAQAAQHAAQARATELACIELLAERTRAAEELASRPHLARALEQQRRLAQEKAEAAQRLQEQRAARLSAGLTAVRNAVAGEQLDQAEQLLDPLAREFPDDPEVCKQLDILRWRLRQRQVAPAEAALRDVQHRRYRDDPEQAVARLAQVEIDGLPEDLARRLFGLWSNACAEVVRQRGWFEPRRYAPATSRGAVVARPSAEAPYEVVSVLGLREWKPGDVVTSPRVLQAARRLAASNDGTRSRV